MIASDFYEAEAFWGSMSIDFSVYCRGSLCELWEVVKEIDRGAWREIEIENCFFKWIIEILQF